MIDRETPLAKIVGQMKTQDWVEMSVLFDNNICPTISASGVSLSIISYFTVVGKLLEPNL